MLDQHLLPVVAGMVGAEDFYNPTFAKAFTGMKRLHSEGKVFDVLTLRDFTGDDLDLAESMNAGTRSPIEEYANIVRRLAERRRVIVGLENVIARAEREDDPTAILSALHEVTMGMARGTDGSRLLSPSKAVDLYERETIRRNTVGSIGLGWGFATIDRWFQPAQGGEMIVLAARPGIGKTALAEWLSDLWARDSEYPIMFVSLEMSVPQLLDRAVARYGGIPASSIVRGALNEDEKERARVVAEQRRDARIWYLDDPRATTDSVRAAAATLRMLVGGLSAIVIDYLQLLKDNGESEVSRVTRISRNVKAIAREFDVPVLTLSQLNRSVESREDRHPKLHDLRESGAIEQDADRVIGLYRREGTNDLDFEALKNRSGPVKRVALYFDAEHMSFTEGR
jgi:replicative DNA helicase